MIRDLLRLIKRFSSGHSRGQGLIETALLVPILLMVLSGLVEFGFFLNDYLALQDAARNAARFSADGLYTFRDSNHSCALVGGTQDFYRQTACLVNQELAQERPEISLDFGTGIDDVVISVFSIAQDYCTSPPSFPPVQALPPGSGVSCVTVRHPIGAGEAGWSAAEDDTHWGTRNQSSRFSSAQIDASLDNMAPSTGVLIVELTYTYDQKLKLPWITAFISDPVVLHNYALMPLVSAEPTPTPVP
jgi:TadE-like protein